MPPQTSRWAKCMREKEKQMRSNTMGGSGMDLDRTKSEVMESDHRRIQATTNNKPEKVTFASQHLTDLHFLQEMIDEVTTELYQFGDFLFGSEPTDCGQDYDRDARTTWTNDVANAIDGLRRSIKDLHQAKDKIMKFYQ